MKVYLAHSIANTGDFNDSIRISKLIKELGYDVYAPAENKEINDKSNNPSPRDIYNGDVYEILNSDIFVPVLNGSLQDGTISEIGLVSGVNEERYDSGKTTIPIIAYTSNARLLQPQHYHGMASACANHLVLGMVDKWGEFVGGEDDMLEALRSRI